MAQCLCLLSPVWPSWSAFRRRRPCSQHGMEYPKLFFLWVQCNMVRSAPRTRAKHGAANAFCLPSRRVATVSPATVVVLCISLGDLQRMSCASCYLLWCAPIDGACCCSASRTRRPSGPIQDSHTWGQPGLGNCQSHVVSVFNAQNDRPQAAGAWRKKIARPATPRRGSQSQAGRRRQPSKQRAVPVGKVVRSPFPFLVKLVRLSSQRVTGWTVIKGLLCVPQPTLLATKQQSVTVVCCKERTLFLFFQSWSKTATSVATRDFKKVFVAAMDPLHQVLISKKYNFYLSRSETV